MSNTIKLLLLSSFILLLTTHSILQSDELLTDDILTLSLLSIIWLVIGIRLISDVILGCEFVILSESMLPNLDVDDSVRVIKSQTLQINDVVLFHPPEGVSENNEPFMKRVVAVAGQTVEIRGGRTFINGIPQEEEYDLYTADYYFGPVTVPDGKVFCLGDNRNYSEDCHVWVEQMGDEGFVDVKSIIGKVNLQPTTQAVK